MLPNNVFVKNFPPEPNLKEFCATIIKRQQHKHSWLQVQPMNLLAPMNSIMNQETKESRSMIHIHWIPVIDVTQNKAGLK